MARDGDEVSSSTQDARVHHVDRSAGDVRQDLIEDLGNCSSYSSVVTYPMCGVHTTLSIASSGWCGSTSGSSS